MVTTRNAEGVLDPKLTEKPYSRSLKRALLVALRCVDPNAQKRSKMGYVIHMLEADEFPFRDPETLYILDNEVAQHGAHELEQEAKHSFRPSSVLDTSYLKRKRTRTFPFALAKFISFAILSRAVPTRKPTNSTASHGIDMLKHLHHVPSNYQPTVLQITIRKSGIQFTTFDKICSL